MAPGTIPCTFSPDTPTLSGGPGGAKCGPAPCLPFSMKMGSFATTLALCHLRKAAPVAFALEDSACAFVPHLPLLWRRVLEPAPSQNSLSYVSHHSSPADSRRNVPSRILASVGFLIGGTVSPCSHPICPAIRNEALICFVVHEKFMPGC